MPVLTIDRSGTNTVHVTVATPAAWCLEASADLRTWVEIAAGPAAPWPFAGTITVIRDNSEQPQVFYRVREDKTGGDK
jgi:hypothetical protein